MLQFDQATLLLNALLPLIQAEHKTTLKVIRAVPIDRGDYKPDPRSMNALDLAWHIAGSEMFFMTGAATGEFPGYTERPGNVQNSAEIAAWYAENFAAHIEKIQALDGAQLLRRIPFHGFEQTALGYLQIMHAHSIHHRGQLSAYLRPMGAKVPSIYGSSADEPMSGAA